MAELFKVSGSTISSISLLDVSLLEKVQAAQMEETKHKNTYFTQPLQTMNYKLEFYLFPFKYVIPPKVQS